MIIRSLYNFKNTKINIMIQIYCVKSIFKIQFHHCETIYFIAFVQFPAWSIAVETQH